MLEKRNKYFITARIEFLLPWLVMAVGTRYFLEAAYLPSAIPFSFQMLFFCNARRILHSAQFIQIIKISPHQYSSLLRMRSSILRMRSSLVVRASDCQCTSCNGPGFDPSIRRHSGIWGAADEAVLNIVRKKFKKSPPKIYIKNTLSTLLSLAVFCSNTSLSRLPWCQAKSEEREVVVLRVLARKGL